jgi:DNA-binding NarL/FixJ family response regulator
VVADQRGELAGSVISAARYRRGLADNEVIAALGEELAVETDRDRRGASAVPTRVEPTADIIIVSRVRFLREALAEILARDTALSICGLSADLDAALNMAFNRQPDVVILDAAFPNGTEAVRRIREVAPLADVIVFAVEEVEDSVIAWAEAGVAGYSPSSAALADVNAMITDIMRGEQSCSGRVAAGLLRRISTATLAGAGRSVAPSITSRITARERQIIELVEAGLSNKEIARGLNIGVGTTKSHIHNVLGKLGLNRRGQLARWMSENKDQLRAGSGGRATRVRKVDGPGSR